MRRRDFLSNSSLFAMGSSALLLTAFKEPASPINKGDAETGTSLPTGALDLTEISIGDLAQGMAEGKYSSAQLTEYYLNRISTIDKSGPRLNAVIETNPDAMSIAKSLDKERKQGKIRGILHGIPILVKDNIDTADKMLTTAGSIALMDNRAKKDAFIIKKLREAGAILLGKTNLSEWANFRSTKSCSGWSSRGGQTKNPYFLDHNPCGSSAGSGVAVSANLCVVAVGTETDGSVTCPASVNGVVGIKPTVGLLSRSGIIPISHTQDTAGPLARTVTDAAILLAAMAGVDASDPATNESLGKWQDYRQFLITGALKGKIIGVEKKKYENPLLNALQEKALNLVKQQGATVVEIEYLDKVSANGDAESDVLKYEFKHDLNNYLSGASSQMKSLKDLIEFNKAHEDKAMPTFKQELFIRSEELEGLDSTVYLNALNKSQHGTRLLLDEIMQQNKLDAIAGLTMGPACSIDTIYGDRWGEVVLTSPAAMSGYPHISVPCGFVYGLPVGLSFFSGPFQEGQIIGMAYAYEQASRNRKLPGFKKSFLD